MKTITCPTCNLEHGLFWAVGGKGEKTLSYRCNRVQRQVHVRGLNNSEFHTITETRTVTDDVVLLNAQRETLPEEWSRAWREKQQNKQQRQFTLMYRR